MSERETAQRAGAPETPRPRDSAQGTESPRDPEILQGQAIEPAARAERDSAPIAERDSAPIRDARRGANVTRIKQAIYFIFGAVNILILIRFVLLLLGASDASPFVGLVYGMSRGFVAPFSGIFAEPTLGGSVFEWAALVAIIIYALVAYGIARIVELAYAPAQSTITRAS
jgi:YGGT family